MFIPLDKVKPGHVYKTNDLRFPYAYVMRIVFQYALECGIPKAETVKEFDQIITRFYCRHGIEHYAAHEYFAGYTELGDRRFVEELDLPLQFNHSENKFYVKLEKDCIWHIESMCQAVWQGSKIYSQVNPYKFGYRILIGKETYHSKSNLDVREIPEVVKILQNVIGFDKFVYFNHLSGNGYDGIPTYTGSCFYFQTEEDYNLARISLPIT